MKFAAGETSVMLTAGHGDIADIDGLPAAFPDDYTFQWVRVDADGPSNPADINDATSGVYTRADGGLHSVPVSCVLADPRRQPDLAGGVQRGRSECRRGGLRNVRHDGRADRCRGVGASAQYDVTVSGGNLGSLNATVTLSFASGCGSGRKRTREHHAGGDDVHAVGFAAGGRVDCGDEPCGRQRHRQLQRHGAAVEVGHQRRDRGDRRHAGHGQRRYDGDRVRQCGQHRHGVDRVPGGGQGRSDAERVRLQRGLEDDLRLGTTNDLALPVLAGSNPAGYTRGPAAAGIHQGQGQGREDARAMSGSQRPQSLRRMNRNGSDRQENERDQCSHEAIQR